MLTERDARVSGLVWRAIATWIIIHQWWLLCSVGCNRKSDAVVSGGSMAPAMLGEHYLVECSDCRFVFACNGLSRQPAATVDCPNCGYSENRLFAKAVRPGTPVFVLPNQKLNRWDIVALGSIHEKGLTTWKPLSVKRIVGFPGETVTIANGNIFVDGQLQRKPIEVQKRMMIPVFNSDFLPADTSLPPRWSAANTSTSWMQVDNSWEFTVVDPTPVGDQDWLQYCHWRGYRHRGLRTDIWFVEDNYAYDELPRRTLNRTDELYFQLTVSLAENSIFRIRLNRMDGELEIGFDPVAKLSSAKLPNGATVTAAMPERFRIFDGNRIEISTIDCALVVLLNGEVALDTAIDPGPQRTGNRNEAKPIEHHPIQLSVESGRFCLRGMQIWRDVYYVSENTDELAGDWMHGAHLGANQFFVLGDNSPVSVDSRSRGPVLASEILGSVEPK